MKLFKSLFKLGVVAALGAGWAVAAASLHVVRSPGDPSWLGKVTVLPKDKLTFKDTFVDTTHWSITDRLAHSAVESRLREANKLDLLQHIQTETSSCCPADKPAEKSSVVEKAPPVEKTTRAEEPKRNSNIFDDLNEGKK